MKRLVSFLSLFTSTGTLFCCALPVLFVTLGAGATFAGLASTFPQLIWLSEYKEWTFGLGAVMLVIAHVLRARSKQETCPVDPKLREDCEKTRDWSKWVLYFSTLMYLVGFTFAYVLPLFI